MGFLHHGMVYLPEWYDGTMIINSAILTHFGELLDYFSIVWKPRDMLLLGHKCFT